MQRRTLLATIGSIGTLALAGCSGDSSNYEGDDENNDENGNDDEQNLEEDEDEGEDAQDQENDIEILNHEVESEQITDDLMDVRIVGEVQNNSGEELSMVEVKARCFDSSGNQIDTYSDLTRDLQDGGTWSFEVMILDGEELDSYELAVEGSTF